MAPQPRQVLPASIPLMASAGAAGHRLPRPTPRPAGGRSDPAMQAHATLRPPRPAPQLRLVPVGLPSGVAHDCGPRVVQAHPAQVCGERVQAQAQRALGACWPGLSLPAGASSGQLARLLRHEPQARGRGWAAHCAAAVAAAAAAGAPSPSLPADTGATRPPAAAAALRSRRCGPSVPRSPPGTFSRSITSSPWSSTPRVRREWELGGNEMKEGRENGTAGLKQRGACKRCARCPGAQLRPAARRRPQARCTRMASSPAAASSSAASATSS